MAGSALPDRQPLARPIVAPADIPRGRGANIILGLCLLGLGIVAAIPIYGVIKYDGLASFLDWPSLFYWFGAIAALFIGAGLYFLFSPQKAGAEARFTQGGFKLDVQRYFRRGFSYDLAWTDIEAMIAIDAPRGGSIVAFRLTRETALKHGLIQPTTRYEKRAAKRDIALPIVLTGVGLNEAVERFRASAEQAGATLVKSSSVYLLVLSRKVWTIEWH